MNAASYRARMARRWTHFVASCVAQALENRLVSSDRDLAQDGRRLRRTWNGVRAKASPPAPHHGRFVTGAKRAASRHLDLSRRACEVWTSMTRPHVPAPGGAPTKLDGGATVTATSLADHAAAARGAALSTLLALTLGLASCAAMPQTTTSDAPREAAAAPAKASQGGPWFALVTPDGLLVAINDHSLHMTLELRGADVRPGRDDATLYLVDGQIVQFTVASSTDLGAGGTQGKALLEVHMAWESRYIAESLGLPNVPRRLAEGDAPAGRPWLVWVIDQTPLPDSTAETRGTGNVFATTVVEGQILVVSSPIVGAATDTDVSKRLIEILASLDMRAAPISPEVESRRLRGEP